MCCCLALATPSGGTDLGGSIPFYCTHTARVQGRPVLDGAFSHSSSDFLLPAETTLWISVSDPNAEIASSPPMSTRQCALPLGKEQYTCVRDRGEADAGSWLNGAVVHPQKVKHRDVKALAVLWVLRYLEMLLGSRYKPGRSCWVSVDRKLVLCVAGLWALWRRVKLVLRHRVAK
eukprot:TRINITY_DN7174_c0_g1_i2.p3 TRINITY_DN7174_c0_g1~~TRINITY_DN7174_c0_g1_i2.p3  ORF type:complete len:175 (+),score=28.62 TRINITY_DN7174_c0_g1_i2:757-1281(+)